MALFQPTYFAPIIQYAAVLNSNNTVFEFEDNFQKQTYRSRCYIYGPNGKQLLNVPIKHHKKEGRKKTKEIRIDYDTDLWQKNHFKSLQAAYRSSPYFEFYEDDLAPLFEKKEIYLIDLLVKSHEFIMDALQIEKKYIQTTKFEITPTDMVDFRILADAKKKIELDFPSYIQMFDDKHGFIPNLSILDLLFMEGPSSMQYLEKIFLNNESNLVKN